MAEKVLSQAEINALFSAMSEGQVDVESDTGHYADISPYDLSSRRIKLLEEFDVLEEVHDKFAGFLRNILASTLRVGAEADFISTEMMKFGEFLNEFSKPTSFHIYSMEPLPGTGLLVIVDNLVFSLIDCMFGGTGKPISRSGDFTLIEQRLMTRLAADILRGLEKAWERVHSVRIVVKGNVTNPEFVHQLAPNDLVMVVGFSVTGNEFSGNIYLCLPYLTIEPIKEKLSYKNLRAESGEPRGANIKELLADANVTVSVELGKTRRTVNDILGLKAGDVILLDTGPQDNVPVSVEKIPKFLGTPGIVKGKRAVRISSVRHV